MEELSTQEKEQMEKRWEEMKEGPGGMPKMESWVSFLSPNVIMIDQSPESRGFGSKITL